MRVLLAVGSLPPDRCGVGTYTADLARELAQAPDFSVAVLSAAEGDERDGFEVLRPRRGWALRGAWSILTQVRRWRPDVAHFQYPAHGYGPHPLPWILPTFLRLMGIRIAITWHEYQHRLHLIDLPNTLLPGGLVAVRPSFLEQMPPLFRRLVRRKKFRMIANAASIPALELSSAHRAEVRRRFGPEDARLLAYFGFVYDHKGVEDLFAIADPTTDVLILVAELRDDDEYHRRISQLASSSAWAGRCFVTGFLPADEVAEVLAAADAVVLPFRMGGGMWNTSLAAAAAQGTFVLTTSTDGPGYDPERNVQYTVPGDLEEMRRALRNHSGKRVPANDELRRAEWRRIVEDHASLYQELLA
ncbi:MAG TPA: glycosyltransferase [Thermoanaerobaculia bacterium]|jgi:glycosyltransferase involved in cell wall biosynthesis|nr:glycosyltransferase [Thermoanaerobaculia bacterium]